MSCGAWGADVGVRFWLGYFAVGAVLAVGCSGPSREVATNGPDPFAAPGQKPFAGLNIGECISSQEVQSKKGSVWSVACPSNSNPYELAFKGPVESGCPDGKTAGQHSIYTSVTETGAKTPTTPFPPTIISCFVLNMVPGQCYFRGVESNYFTHTADCQTPGAKFQVASQRSDANGTCEPGQDQYSWPVPPRTVCLTPIPG